LFVADTIQVHHLKPPITLLLGIILSCAACPDAFALPPAVLAQLLKVEGLVLIKRAGDTAFVPVNGAETLASGDQVQTSDSASLVMVFLEDKSLLKLTPRTTVTLDAKEGDEGGILTQVLLGIGRIFVRVGEQLGTIEVLTPTSVATIKGTEFWVVVFNDGTTKVITASGLVELINRRSGEVSFIGSGQQGESRPDGTILMVKHITWEEEEGELETRGIGLEFGIPHSNGFSYRRLAPTGWGYQIGATAVLLEEDYYLKASIAALYPLSRTRLTAIYLLAGVSFLQTKGEFFSHSATDLIYESKWKYGDFHWAVGVGPGLSIRALTMERLWGSVEVPLTYFDRKLLPVPAAGLHYMMW